MSAQNPDPDRHQTPGLPQDGGVPPGETPPAEESTGSETGPRGDLTRGWGKAPLIVIGIVVAVFVVFFIAYAVSVAQ
ncbi:DUF6480 family protein [Streptomyces sp. NPDC048638]|uniref:DUF6480 family protein n=1 Tax=Streptomyces sp. NPDC048638 TaxID=3365580 RepID=UPI0037145942